MRRAITVLSVGTAPCLRASDTLLLDYDQRQNPRGRHVALRGTEIEMALTPSMRLQTDDRLMLSDDSIIEIVARPEPLYEVRAGSVSDLARIAWMLGDRHLPVEISERRLRVRRDPAIAALLGNASLKITAIDAPFEPEGGAYSHASSGGASHPHSCTHSEHDH